MEVAIKVESDEHKILDYLRRQRVQPEHRKKGAARRRFSNEPSSAHRPSVTMRAACG
jgi:hypothetical protein